jgi:hypothetical protein
VKNATVQGTVSGIKYHFEWSESPDFPQNSLTGSSTDNGGNDPDQDGSGSTSFTLKNSLRPNFKYYWHAKAVGSGVTDSDYSSTESFTTENKGFFSGFNIYDPLTDGTSVASRIVGGHFVTGANGGWQSDSLVDGLDYDIQTCNDCTVEFDATNFGAGEGSSISIDVKWFSMGDRNFWNGFSPFRDHPWKMHLEQRSDGDGTGMQVIWRNGAADADTGGDPEYGDHRGKYTFGGPNWGHSYDNKVWHFTIKWTPTTYVIYINELGQPLRQWFPGAGDSGRFGGGHSYSPSNHRIELGCIPRGESMIGARYRNFRLSHN